MHPSVHSSNVQNSQTGEGDEMSFNRRMDQEDVVHIYNGILAIRKKNYTTFAATWTALEEIMLSERSQAEKDNCHMVSLICET